MNNREKMLAAVVLPLVALIGGNHYYGLYTKALHTRLADVDTARTKLQDANRKLHAGQNAVQQMQAAQKRSLPDNYERALSLYKAWLLAKANDSGLTVSDIKQFPATSNNPAFKLVSYQIVAGGSLSNVAAMLYEFYRSPQLQQITRLQLTRPPGAQQLKVDLTVEALSIRGAVETEHLPEGDSKRLKLASADDYKKSLGERDLVSAYSPPRPPTPPRAHHEPTAPPKFDDSDLAYFSGAVSSGKGLQAWINVRTTGETIHLVAGDPVKVGALVGEIVSVEARSLVYKTGDKKYRVPLGESLRKGKEIDAKAAAVKESPASHPES